MIRRLDIVMLAGWIVMGFALNAPAGARIKDIAQFRGAQDNQLYGYGLVVGLNGTGDSSALSQLLATNMLERLRMSITPDDLSSKNIAAVMVTADLPAFIKSGSRLDVTVSSLGDASNLEGGVLVQTPLQGADGQVYAVAQGALSTGGFDVQGTAASVRKNHPTVARIPNGAIIEREVPGTLVSRGALALSLREPDFVSAAHMADAINARFPGSASAEDAATVWVQLPAPVAGDPRQLVPFVAALENLEVQTDTTAKVIINERTGTIVAGQSVRIDSVAVSHGNLAITISESALVSQPEPYSFGDTAVIPQTDVSVEEPKGFVHVMPDGTSIAEIAKALNALGVTPRDMIAIFQAIKQAGALHAELVIM